MTNLIKTTANTQGVGTDRPKGLAIFDYNNAQVEFKIIDGQVYGNATEMCKIFGKRPIDWLRLPQTQRYIEALQVKCKNLTTLIETKKGNSSDFAQGTWVHERLIVKLTQWLDVDFEIWCDEKIAELLRTGRVEYNLPVGELTKRLYGPKTIEVDYRSPICNLNHYFRKPYENEVCEYIDYYQLLKLTRDYSGKKILERQFKRELIAMGFEEGCTEINGRRHWGYKVIIIFLMYANR